MRPTRSRARALLHLRDRLPGVAALSERLLGFSARRSLPRWHEQPYRPRATWPRGRRRRGATSSCCVDTFTTWFEPGIARAAEAVLTAAGCRVHPPAADGSRPLCCGRTFLATGLIEEARREARRTLAALRPLVERGLPVIGLEPSCLLTLRDEYEALLPGPATAALAARALLLEEFRRAEQAAGRLELRLQATPWPTRSAARPLPSEGVRRDGGGRRLPEDGPGARGRTIESSCCGMAGAFGYEASHHAVSLQMAELSLLPAVRAADPDTVLVADGTSCRHQIKDGTGRQALHVAELLQAALA